MSALHPFKKSTGSGVQSMRTAAARLARDVEAFEALCAARPLKPPPMRLMPAVVPASLAALRRDIRLGVVAA
jgi:hypothetical protein